MLRTIMKPQQQIAAFCLICIMIFCSGCPQYADPTVPNPIRRIDLPSGQSDYLIYTPSKWNADTPYPLVILCHGTRPWDYPLRQIRDWVRLAEEKNFIVAAPELKGTKGVFEPKPTKQVSLQRDDEATILATLRHIRAGAAIRSDQVFLNGWSAGGYAVLYTGLKHPEIFRALSVLQGNFNPVYLTDVADRVDPYQPVYVLYGSIDFMTRQEGKECVQWLYDHNTYLTENEVPGIHRSHPKEAFKFFERVVRDVPWLHLRAYAELEQPFAVQFKTRSSFEPQTYQWDFGDGHDSPIAEPQHTYSQPGQYTVTLIAGLPNGKRVKRTTTINVPLGKLYHDLDE